VSVKKKNFGITQSVEVVPTVDFNRLEEVTVVEPPRMPLETATIEEEPAPVPEPEPKVPAKKGVPAP
jgi:cell shape-determining protein MreC